MKPNDSQHSQGQTLIVKFHSFKEPEQEFEHIRKILGKRLVIGTAQLFPGETSEELACLYTVDLTDEDNAEMAIQKLMSDPNVEYAHLPQIRTPASST